MEKNILQSLCLQFIYKGIIKWFLKIVVGVQFGNSGFLKNEEQFIILANHNSHLDTLSLMASLPHELLWKVKPVAAEDYFGNTKLKAKFSNYFINTLLIRRKGSKDSDSNPIRKMIKALDEGYSLILFPEGTRGSVDKMENIKPGIARVLSERPHIKYIPVYLSGMGKSLPKGESLVLPYKSSVNYGEPARVSNAEPGKIMEEIISNFDALREKYQTIIHDDED